MNVFSYNTEHRSDREKAGRQVVVVINQQQLLIKRWQSLRLIISQCFLIWEGLGPDERLARQSYCKYKIVYIKVIKNYFINENIQKIITILVRLNIYRMNIVSRLKRWGVVKEKIICDSEKQAIGMGGEEACQRQLLFLFYKSIYLTLIYKILPFFCALRLFLLMMMKKRKEMKDIEKNNLKFQSSKIQYQSVKNKRNNKVDQLVKQQMREWFLFKQLSKQVLRQALPLVIFSVPSAPIQFELNHQGLNIIKIC
ncbi:hypothetical protein ABPG74_008298 [Tetrahymena malaccensis]